MDIKVSGRKTTVTDALRAHVDEKIGEALKVFDIEPMTVDVVLRYEKNPSSTHGLMKAAARKRHPRFIISRKAIPRLFNYKRRKEERT